jgi:predicted transcriptional regulator
MENKHVGHTWNELEDELLEKGALAQEEIIASRLRAEIIGQLCRVRNERKISQRELEKITGISQTTIARIESGRNSPSLNTMLKILVPLGMTLAVVPR